MKGLLTIDTVLKADICKENESIEDCVLVYNSKIIMNALVLVSQYFPSRLIYVLF